MIQKYCPGQKYWSSPSRATHVKWTLLDRVSRWTTLPASPPTLPWTVRWRTACCPTRWSWWTWRRATADGLSRTSGDRSEPGCSGVTVERGITSVLLSHSFIYCSVCWTISSINLLFCLIYYVIHSSTVLFVLLSHSSTHLSVCSTIHSLITFVSIFIFIVKLWSAQICNSILIMLFWVIKVCIRHRKMIALQSHTISVHLFLSIPSRQLKW
jgi:hypothetical protein